MVDFGEKIKSRSFSIPSGESRELPDWLRTLAITGPLENIEIDGWQSYVKDLIWDFVDKIEGDPILAVQQSSISDFILDFADDIRVKYPNLKVELHKLNYDHLYLPFIPEDLQDIYEELGPDSFPELLRALSARDNLKWLRKFGKNEDKADEIKVYSDDSWTFYKGQGRKKTPIHYHMEEKSADVLQIRLAGDTSFLGGEWWMKRRSGATVMILDLPGNKESHVDVYYNH